MKKEKMQPSALPAVRPGCTGCEACAGSGIVATVASPTWYNLGTIHDNEVLPDASEVLPDVPEVLPNASKVLPDASESPTGSAQAIDKDSEARRLAGEAYRRQIVWDPAVKPLTNEKMRRLARPTHIFLVSSRVGLRRCGDGLYRHWKALRNEKRRARAERKREREAAAAGECDEKRGGAAAAAGGGKENTPAMADSSSISFAGAGGVLALPFRLLNNSLGFPAAPTGGSNFGGSA
ncbi:hypothetical protein QBC37DRAFT_403207 [Rhypophila decipiens]|uniref:Uncharacterized protein n=1 Tax=Rhypophila decipiens TaxID=261697 RepID=A0AAN6Y132_9PEZI|nr:hypothetical protein QBC37DRAFT_403207 [Rhypophila decipiens]